MDASIETKDQPCKSSIQDKIASGEQNFAGG